MTDKNSETSFIDLENICDTRCFIVVIGLIGVNTGDGNDLLVCNVFHGCNKCVLVYRSMSTAMPHLYQTIFLDQVKVTDYFLPDWCFHR